MVKSDVIEYAIAETIDAHPEFEPFLTQILFKNIQDRIYLKNFTSQNGARDQLAGLKKIDLVNYVIEQMIKIVNAATNYALNDPSMEIVPDEQKRDALLEVFPHYESCKKILENCSEKPNKIIYLMQNPVELISAVFSVMKTKFPSSKLTEYINSNCYINVPLSNTTTDKLLHELREEYEILGPTDNIQINKKGINNCLADLLTGQQLKNTNNQYSLNGELYASQDKGIKQKQEDSVIIMNHPSNPDFSFLAVADGVGGDEKSELASSYLLSELAKWFEVLPVSLFSEPQNLQELFNQKLNQISKEIYEKYNSDGEIKASTTFTGAIITSDITVISTIGDSRAYTLGVDGINIVTKDESAVWPKDIPASQLGFDFIDDIRFNKASRFITRCIGVQELAEIQCYQIPNNSYEKLLLLTDGVTDLLATDRIRFITQKTPTNLIVKQLVDEAIKKSAYRKTGGNQMYDASIPAGKDNASAVMYTRR